MNEIIFFEIPIYRCSRKEHTNYMEKEKLKWENPDAFTSFSWFAWKYYEIIGYLNLSIFGTQFTCDTWLIDKKRIPKGITKKKFKLLGKTFEKNLPKNKTSKEIFDFINESLVEYNKSDFKKHYFDLRTFNAIGQFVDWLELTKKLNSFSNPDIRKKYFENNS